MNSLPLISPYYYPLFKDEDPQRLREVKSPAQGHTASEWKDQFPRSQMCDSQISACMLSCFSRVQLFVTPWTVAHQAPLSMGFSRQEYWSKLTCPPPGDLYIYIYSSVSINPILLIYPSPPLISFIPSFTNISWMLHLSCVNIALSLNLL